MESFMKKTYIAIILTSVIPLLNLYAEPAKTAEELKKKQREIALKVFEMRKTLIQSDAKLMELHKEKLRIHRLISERISGNAKMAELIEEAVKLQAEIEELNKPQENVIENVEKTEKEIAKPEIKPVTKKETQELVTEPVHRSRKRTTIPKVIDRTADAHIEENDGLSYE